MELADEYSSHAAEVAHGSWLMVVHGLHARSHQHKRYHISPRAVLPAAVTQASPSHAALLQTQSQLSPDVTSASYQPRFSSPAIELPAVSYTHLTLPTIYSV